MKFWRIGFVLVAITAGTVGCTEPTQKLASIAFDRGVSHMSDVNEDLVTITKQQILDLGVAEVRNAKTPDEAQQAMEKAFNGLNKVAWLEVQMEKAKAYLHLAQIYISSQQGVLDLLYKDLQKAKQAVNSSNP